LTGPPPRLEKVQFARSQRKALDQYFDRYVPRYLKVTRSNVSGPTAVPVRRMAEAKSRAMRAQVLRSEAERARNAATSNRARQHAERLRTKMQAVRQTKLQRMQVARQTKLRRMQARPKKVARKKQAAVLSRPIGTELDRIPVVPVSNEVGVGILSYNRIGSLRRLVESLRRHTDLTKTTVVISDESTDARTRRYTEGLSGQEFAILHSDRRIGVAGNTNRLMQCLERFRYRIIMNDDVEVLRPGWEHHYVSAMKEHGYHHFCMRQSGVQGARATDGTRRKLGKHTIWTITEKPHGAVLVYDDEAGRTAGFFDERFGLYGMEHVDWSHRISMSGIQPPGYHDVVGSDMFLKICPDASAVGSEKSSELSRSRVLFKKLRSDRNRIYVGRTTQSDVKGVSCIVPFRSRDQDNIPHVLAVMNNLRAQRHPLVEVIVVEQDGERRVEWSETTGARHVLVGGPSEFSKSTALNLGASISSHGHLVLHDADVLVHGNYLSTVVRTLNDHESAHVCGKVVYLTEESSNEVCLDNLSIGHSEITRTSSEFAGGSIGIRKEAYIRIGGLCEEFIGYGSEDKEFQDRLEQCTEMCRDGDTVLFHLFHVRMPGWQTVHGRRNEEILKRMREVPMKDRVASLCENLRNIYGL